MRNAVLFGVVWGILVHVACFVSAHESFLDVIYDRVLPRATDLSVKEHVDNSSDLNRLRFEAEDASYMEEVLDKSPFKEEDIGAALLEELAALKEGQGLQLGPGLELGPELGPATGLQQGPAPSHRTRRTATHSDDHLWPNANVPYLFDPDIQRSATYRDAIQEAFAHIQDVTCVRFTEVNRHYGRRKKMVKFLRGTSCHSSVGKGDGIGEQEVTLSRTCAYPELVIHELGHLLGLWHEHARTDRDNNVLVLINNVRPGYEHNFKIASPMRLMAPYDLSSMMHYDTTTFTANSDLTIMPLDEDMSFLIGKKTEFSFYDKYTLNKLYRCADWCPDLTKCKNGGFLDKRCNCVCPGGLSGKTCESVLTDKACGGIVDIKKSLEITSPGYPGEYPNNMECRWFIRSPVGTVMTFAVPHIDLERSIRGSCRDELEIRYHHIGIGKGPRYCGTSLNKTFESTTNTMIIKFTSNYVTALGGFRGIIKVKPKTDCSSNPCLNGGNCYTVSTIDDYLCDCPGNWVGHNCEKEIRDGGWSAWSTWSSCVAPCGKQSRSRQCTDPLPANGGEDCVGAHYETRKCGDEQLCKGTFSCDFGTNGTLDICGIANEDDTDKLDWQLQHGPTQSQSTGPVSGHTTGTNNDNFLYLEASFGKAYDDAVIWLPTSNLSMGMYCLQFFFNMRGTSMGSLVVFRKMSRSRAVVMWQRTGDQGSDWHEVNIDVLYFRQIEIGFMAVRGDTFSSDITIDDLSLSPGRCHREETETNNESYGCTMGKRRYRVGAFVATDGCLRLNCFCNPDGVVDCPEWQSEEICDEYELKKADQGLLWGASKGKRTWQRVGQNTSGMEQVATHDKADWPHWLKVAHKRSKKRRGRRIY